MALEQLRAFREGRPQETLGPTEILEPDGFPLLASSELRAEHGKIGPLLNKLARDLDVDKMRAVPEVAELLKADQATRTRLYLAMIERTFAYDAKLSRADSNYSDGYFFDYGPAARVMALLFDTGVDAAAVAEPTLEWFNCYRFVYYGTEPLARVMDWIAQTYAGRAEDIPGSLREKLEMVRGQCRDLGGYKSYGEVLDKKIAAILGDGPWNVLVPSEVWAAEATEELRAVSPDRRDAWLE